MTMRVLIVTRTTKKSVASMTQYLSTFVMNVATLFNESIPRLAYNFVAGAFTLPMVEVSCNLGRLL